MNPKVDRLLIANALLGTFLGGVGARIFYLAMPRGRAQGYMITVHHCGFLLGPNTGGFIIDYLGWRWAFFPSPHWPQQGHCSCSLAPPTPSSLPAGSRRIIPVQHGSLLALLR